MKGGKSIYYPELDGLRFLAFLLVFIHHTPQLVTFGFLKPVESFLSILHKYGWMGVDLFLCLSAFLFTKLLFIEHSSQGDINVKNFYIRRLLRIWPLYYFFITLMIMMTVSSGGWTRTVALRSLGLATFTDNIVTAFLGYNLAIAASRHLWTISYEEQFYAVIPWFLRRMFIMSRVDKLKVVLAIFFCFSAIRAYMIYQDVGHPTIWVLPITHFEAILGGIIVGLGWLGALERKVSSRMLLVVGIICLVLVCFLPNVNEIGWHLMLTYPSIGIGVSLIMYGILQEDGSFVKNVFQNRVLAYLGKISYGLYVYHILAINYSASIAARFNILREQVIVFPLFVFIVGFSLTALFSMISYHFLERPFLRYKKKFTSIESRPI